LNNYLSSANRAVRKCFQNYATFKGRASRSEFWYFWVFFIVANYLATVISSTLGSLVSLGLLLPYLAVGVRRMHDRNRSGWFVLVPVYNLYLAVTLGDSGPNRFGANPETF